MLERLQALPLLIMGALMTRACVMFGLAGLVSIWSGTRGEPAPGSTTTNSITVRHRSPFEMAGLVRALRTKRGGVTAGASPRTLYIAGPPAEVVRLARIVREVDQPASMGQRIWTVAACAPRDDDLARMWAAWWDYDRGWRPPALVTKIIRDDRHDQLIIVGNEAGYRRVQQMCVYEPRHEGP
jgi:type II secretory pathway component GspD/PulD (secretin)